MNNLTNEIKRKIGKKRLFYVCRDVERAATGRFLNLPNFFIITNDSPYARELTKTDRRILMVPSEKNNPPLGTFALLQTKLAVGKIEPQDYVVVFKPTKMIETFCKTREWKLLNPQAELSNQVEGKISQVDWLGSLAKKLLPPHMVMECGKISWREITKKFGDSFIIQFNYGHTGSGTFFIQSPKELTTLQTQFPVRPARVTKYIDGLMFTSNNLIWNKKVYTGNISYQITGLPSFTKNRFSTIGNDWALPQQILTKSQFKEYQKIATAVGKKLATEGWRGLYGIDVIMDQTTKKLYLIEINARQPASTTWESELQNKSNQITTFATHLAALLNIKNSNFKPAAVIDGAQIIKRVGTPKLKTPIREATQIIQYQNTNPDADDTRYQFTHGIMADHNKIKNI